MTDALITAEAPDTTPADTSLVANEPADTTPADDTPAGEDKLYVGKYKTVEDLEKGYKELSGKVRELPKSPDKYEFDFKEHENLDLREVDLTDDPLMDIMGPLFKESNVSQEVAQRLVEGYLGYEMGKQESKEDMLKAVGGDAAVAEIQAFVNRNIPDDLKSVAVSLGSSSDGLKFMHALAQQHTTPASLSNNTPVNAGELRIQANEIRKGTKNFSSDRDAVRRYEELMDTAAKAELAKGKR